MRDVVENSNSKSESTFRVIGAALRDYVQRCAPCLRRLSATEAVAPRGEGKWTKIEILGHLVDSAANNHHRFVRVQESSSEFAFPGYAQDQWVSTQGYAEADWNSVVSLWERYNLHLATVIDRIPSEHAETPCRIGDEPPQSLADLARDYVDHACHHIEQVVDVGDS